MNTVGGMVVWASLVYYDGNIRAGELTGDEGGTRRQEVRLR